MAQRIEFDNPGVELPAPLADEKFVFAARQVD